MNRRHLFLGVSTLAALALVATWLMHGASPFRAKFDRIEIGMTEREVTTILGEPEFQVGLVSLYVEDFSGDAIVISFEERNQQRIVAGKQWQSSFWNRVRNLLGFRRPAL